MLLVWLFFLSSLARADGAGPPALIWAQDPEAVKIVADPKIYRVLDSDEDMDLKAQGYLPIDERSALFHKLKLESAVQDFDELDMDTLVMGARFEKLGVLKKYYPGLTESQLRQLQAEVKGHK